MPSASSPTVSSASASLPTVSSASLSSLDSSKLNVSALTWNVENLKSNRFTLKYFVDLVVPDFIFLNETQIFQFEEQIATDVFHGDYCHSLNSDDIFDTELPFIKKRSFGGTMILWKSSLDQFVTVLPKVSASFLAILFHPPGSPPSIHVSLYLPTSGKETQFIEEISKLRIYLEDLLEDQPDYLIYLRGDSNVNAYNKARSNVFNDFKSNLKMIHVPLGHKTAHHFMGDGLFD